MENLYHWVMVPLLALAAVLLWNFVPRHRRLGRFAGRDDLPLDRIYSDFFASVNLPKSLVLQLWSEVATAVQVPAGKLRPSDRFDKELAPVEGWEFDDGSCDLDWAARRRLKRLGISADLSQVQTLKDYIEFFCRLET